LDKLCADVLACNDGLQRIGLRCFNVLGPRQAPNGDCAPAIPVWATAGETVDVKGDSQTSRAFCCVAKSDQANLLAGMATRAVAARDDAGGTSRGAEYSAAGPSAQPGGRQAPTYRD
jgi:UDP-N-acetylglucosamine/UDP-N-acetylgalactosamine 4-epimerase